MQSPRHIAIVLDSSGSMRDDRTWELARNVAFTIVMGVDSADRVTLLAFDSEVHLRVDGHGQSQTIVGKLGSLPTNRRDFAKRLGTTALYDAILVASAGRENERPDTIIVITDGVDTASRHNEGDVGRALADANQRLFGVFVENVAGGQIPRELGGADELNSLMKATGGIGVVTSYSLASLSTRRKLEEIGADLAAMLALLQHSFRMTLKTEREIDKARSLTLSYRENKGKRENRLFLYPPVLFPCRH